MLVLINAGFGKSSSHHCNTFYVCVEVSTEFSAGLSKSSQLDHGSNVRMHFMSV